MINRQDRATTFRRLQKEFNEGKEVSQREMCIRYLLDYGSITPLEALEAFGCFRLSAVIFDLRHEGYNIRTDINDGKKKYAIYVLEEEQEQE